MQGKKSFLLYCDMIHYFEDLNDEQAGKLIKIIFEYVNDNNPIIKDQILKIAFTPIKLSLKRDLEEWSKKCVKNSINGKKGGRPTKKSERLIEKPKKANGLFENPLKPKKADSDSDSDSDIDKEIKKEIFSFSDLLLEFQKNKPLKRPFFLRMSELHSIPENEVLKLFHNWALKNEGKEMTVTHAENSFNLYLKSNKPKANEPDKIVLPRSTTYLRNPQ